MSHNHDHGHRVATDRRALAIALALIVAFLVAEVIAALIAGSLALLADAGHMLTDAGALAFALFAATLASRPAQGRWTFGYKRLEILAAQVNGITLLVVALLIVYGSVRRLISPDEVRGGIVVGVALAGIGVNLAATGVLARASRESLNVRGAVSARRHGQRRLRGDGDRGRVDSRDRLGPVRSDREPVRRRADAVGELGPAARVVVDLPRAVAFRDRPRGCGSGAGCRAGRGRGARLARLDRDERLPALAAHVLVAPDSDCHAIRRTSSRCSTTGSSSSTRRCRSSMRNPAC
jgi:cobalt-zinc-cadmium efflux system protein